MKQKLTTLWTKLGHFMGWHKSWLKYWHANCGKVMRCRECECGAREDIRPAAYIVDNNHHHWS